jgi:hypothetical protein
MQQAYTYIIFLWFHSGCDVQGFLLVSSRDKTMYVWVYGFAWGLFWWLLLQDSQILSKLFKNITNYIQDDGAEL